MTCNACWALDPPDVEAWSGWTAAFLPMLDVVVAQPESSLMSGSALVQHGSHW